MAALRVCECICVGACVSVCVCVCVRARTCILFVSARARICVSARVCRARVCVCCVLKCNECANLYAFESALGTQRWGAITNYDRY